MTDSRRTRRRSSPRRIEQTLFAARVDPRTKARVGSTMRLARRAVAALLLLARDRRDAAGRRRAAVAA